MAKDSSWGKFVDAHEQTGLNIIGVSEGGGGSGKSHFWLTAPEPIAYFLLDPGGLKGLTEQKDFAGKEIRKIDFSSMLDLGRLEQAQRVERGLEIMELFNEQWDVALRKAKTIIVDKEDLLWETKRWAHDEGCSPKPLNFGELNLWYRALYAQAEAVGVNLGMVRGQAEVWGNIGRGKQGFTGEKRPRGHKEARELAQINLLHWFDEGDEETTRGFKVKILEKCRLGNAKKLLGKTIEELDFETLWTMLFPGEDYEETWG